MKNILFDFDDILIIPTEITPIKSRKDVNPFYPNGSLPLMTAPMDTVVDIGNAKYFDNVNIMSVLPRVDGVKRFSSKYFISYSLKDFEDFFLNETALIDTPLKALIDVANGHMTIVRELALRAKQKYGDKLILMVGNVANPYTYEIYQEIGVDYVRIGIGNGNGCLTTVQTGVGFPMASLIIECKKLQNSDNKTKIVADGGFKKYSDIIKGLALGADYVMLGSIFNKALESAGRTIRYEYDEIMFMNTATSSEVEVVVNQFNDKTLEMFNVGIPLYKTFRGMSTKEAQKDLGKNDLKTSEGVVRKQKVEYTLKGWVDNFESYLRSAMSYTGKYELSEFIGGVDIEMITQNSFRRFDK